MMYQGVEESRRSAVLDAQGPWALMGESALLMQPPMPSWEHKGLLP